MVAGLDQLVGMQLPMEQSYFLISPLLITAATWTSIIIFSKSTFIDIISG